MTYKGQTITYENAVCTGGGDDPVVLRFTDPTKQGSLFVPGEATATILAVGGGARAARVPAATAAGTVVTAAMAAWWRKTPTRLPAAVR